MTDESLDDATEAPTIDPTDPKSIKAGLHRYANLLKEELPANMRFLLVFYEPPTKADGPKASGCAYISDDAPIRTALITLRIAQTLAQSGLDMVDKISDAPRIHTRGEA